MNKNEHAKRYDEVLQVRSTFARRDAAATTPLGSNEPLASERARQILTAAAKPLAAKEILMQARAAGYNGPDSRMLLALRRMVEETGEVGRVGTKYRIA